MTESVEFIGEIEGIYFRSVLLQSGDTAEQHSHPYSHPTLCGNGSAVVYVDGEMKGILAAGEAILIEANRKHSFVARESNTRLTCIHISESAEAAKTVPVLEK